jgi:hypothetical protein
MRFPLLVAALALTAFAGVSAQSNRLPRATIGVSDRFFADSTTTGAIILAKFRTQSQRADLLRLETFVDSTKRHAWSFQDILVTLSLSGNGVVAYWKIAGPRRVIDAYLARVRKLAADPSVIYDYEIRPAIVRCECD